MVLSTQIFQWGGSPTLIVVNDSVGTSDALSVDAATRGATIQLRLDHSGTPAAGDTVEVYFLTSIGGDEFSTYQNAPPADVVDLSAGADPSTTIAIPLDLPVAKVRVAVRKTGAGDVTVSARLIELVGQETAADNTGVAMANVSGKAGFAQTRLCSFTAAGEMPSDLTDEADVRTHLVTFNAFDAGAKRATITYHSPPGGGVCSGVFCTINAGDRFVAAKRLVEGQAITGGSTQQDNTEGFLVSEANPSLTVDLRDVESDILDVYLVGVAGGSGTGRARVQVVVW